MTHFAPSVVFQRYFETFWVFDRTNDNKIRIKAEDWCNKLFTVLFSVVSHSYRWTWRQRPQSLRFSLDLWPFGDHRVDGAADRRVAAQVLKTGRKKKGLVEKSDGIICARMNNKTFVPNFVIRRLYKNLFQLFKINSAINVLLPDII